MTGSVDWALMFATPRLREVIYSAHEPVRSYADVPSQ